MIAFKYCFSSSFVKSTWHKCTRDKISATRSKFFLLKCPWIKSYLLLILKTFKNDEEWCFSFWNTFFRFRDIQVFVQKLMMSQTVHMTVINHKIENISENIGWVSFKLGSDNLFLASIIFTLVVSFCRTTLLFHTHKAFIFKLSTLNLFYRTTWLKNFFPDIAQQWTLIRC